MCCHNHHCHSCHCHCYRVAMTYCWRCGTYHYPGYWHACHSPNQVTWTTTTTITNVGPSSRLNSAVTRLAG